MAGAGKKTWSTGDVLTASDLNTYLMEQSIMVFATATARDAAITSPSDGMFAYTTTTPADTLSYYNGSSWVAVDLAGDITGITTAANSSMAGGATSGTATLTVDVNNSTSVTAVAADYVLIADTSDSNATKRALISDITALVPQGDLTGLTAGTNIDITAATGPVPTIDLAIDAEVAFADQVASRPEIKDYAETINAIGSTGGGTQDIDITAGNVVTATVDTSANTFTFSNPSATGKGCSFTLILTNGASQTVNWPASVDWAGGTAPTLTAAGVDILTFMTIDAGTIWYGFLAGAAMA